LLSPLETIRFWIATNANIATSTCAVPAITGFEEKSGARVSGMYAT
jgi:hypothetical protein